MSNNDEIEKRLRQFAESPKKGLVDGLIRDTIEHIYGLQSRIDECAEEIEGLEEQLEKHAREIADAVHPVLDLVERPVGTLHASLPPSPAAERALIALHDAVGRRI